MANAIGPNGITDRFTGGGGSGDPGPQGPQGKSAYEVAQEQGFIGDVDEWLESLVGPQGDPGAPGSGAGSEYYVQGMSTVTIDPAITVLSVSGYYATGDGGDGFYKRVGSQPTHLGRFQTQDGQWWELQSTGRVRAKQFGTGTGAGFDNAPAINSATDYLVAKFGGGVIDHGAGSFGIGASVILKSRVAHVGKGIRVTEFSRNAAFLGDMFITQDFASLDSGNSAGGPNRFALVNFSIHGRKDTVTSATGWNIRIYGRAYTIKNVLSEYCCQGGYYSRWGGSSAAWDNDFTDSVMECQIDSFFIQFCKRSCVFDGPHDSQISRMLVAMMYHNITTAAGTSTMIIGDRAGGSQFLSLHAWGESPEWCLSSYANNISITDLIVDDAKPGGGLLRVIGSNNRIQGRGLQFGTDSIKGIQLGEGGVAATSNVIDMMLDRSPLTSIVYANDGGNDLRIAVNATATTTHFSGTRNIKTILSYTTRGAGSGDNDSLFVHGVLSANMQMAVLRPQSTAPAGIAGALYYNSVDNKHYGHNGTTWNALY